MEYKIIVDSCCDLPLDLMQQMNAVKIPLTLRLGTKEYTDDEKLDLSRFMSEMQACKEKVGSAAPAPTLYQDAYEQAGSGFVVTLSSQLSASYANAQLARDMVDPETAKSIHVFDSKSATAAEISIAMKIRDYIREGCLFDEIVKRTESYIKSMKTYFVLERHDNLEKNGRLSKVKGILIRALNIKLVMGADASGQIQLYAKPRGMKCMVQALMDLIAQSGKGKAGDRLIITQCNNPLLARQLQERIEDVFAFDEVLIFPTGGLSSLYTDQGGVVMAF